MTALLPQLQHAAPAGGQRSRPPRPPAGTNCWHEGATGRLLLDPDNVVSVEDFLTGLRLTKIWAGDPSFQELRRRTGVPTSTLADALSSKRVTLPRLDVVQRFLAACGVPAAAVGRWEVAWRTVRARGHGVATLPQPGATPAPPRQLPRDITRFIGRHDLLDRLDRVQREQTAGQRSSPVVMVVGPPGVGKTALVVRWAHRMVDAYPDGQLYIELGPAATNRAVEASEVLPLALQAIGVPDTAIPDGLPGMVGLYRSVTHARRLLVVVDGANDAEQVRPMLPGGPRCFTLITSRQRLSGLVAQDDGLRFTLGPLRPDDAVELIAGILGDEPPPGGTGLRDLARRCGYLPRTLRIAAADLADRRDLLV